MIPCLRGARVQQAEIFFKTYYHRWGVRYNNATNAGDATVWNLTGRHDFTPSLFARAGVGTAFRYPDACQLFAIDESCCIGNPNLKPERSINVNGSVGGFMRAGQSTISLEAIGFYRDITDLISEADHPDGSGNTSTANVSGHVKAKGVTIVGTAAMNRAVSGSSGYTYTQGSAIDAGGYENLPGIPANLFLVHNLGTPRTSTSRTASPISRSDHPVER